MLPPFSKLAYSWEGEDVLVHKIAHDTLGIRKGFYVDVGAHHPQAMSNTQFLYDRDWRGVNIDATPGSMVPFDQIRTEDTNIEIGVALKPGTSRFSMFKNSALNGFLSDAVLRSMAKGGAVPIAQHEIECQPLSVILERCGVVAVDLLLVDAERLDEDVVRSVDYAVCRPKLIMVEIAGARDVAAVQATSIHAFLEAKDYTLFSRLHFSVLYMDDTLLPGSKRGHPPGQL